MDGLRIKKMESMFRDVLSNAMTVKMNDPGVRGVVITNIHLTPDLKQARVYFSHANGPAFESEIIKHLRKSKGFLKKELASAVRLRFIPELDFYYDSTEDEARRIEALFQKIHEEKPATKNDEVNE